MDLGLKYNCLFAVVDNLKHLLKLEWYFDSANIVYKSYVVPILDYCDKFWKCCNMEDEERLKNIKRRAARVLMKVGCSCMLHSDAEHDQKFSQKWMIIFVKNSDLNGLVC